VFSVNQSTATLVLDGHSISFCKKRYSAVASGLVVYSILCWNVIWASTCSFPASQRTFFLPFSIIVQFDYDVIPLLALSVDNFYLRFQVQYFCEEGFADGQRL
jgi:hypothetical protein